MVGSLFSVFLIRSRELSQAVWRDATRRSVTMVDCSPADPGWCKEGGRNLALIAVNGSDVVTLDVRAFDANKTDESCAIDQAWRLAYIAATLIAGCVALRCADLHAHALHALIARRRAKRPAPRAAADEAIARSRR